MMKIAIALVLMTLPLRAAPVEVGRELEAEHQECAVYFAIISQASRNSIGAGQGYEEAAQLADDYDKHSKDMLARAAVLSPHEESPEAFQARIDMIRKEQLTVINKDVTNISVLLQRYATFCKHLALDPTSRVHEIESGRMCDSEYHCR